MSRTSKHYGIFFRGKLFGLKFGEYLMQTSEDKKYLQYLKNVKWKDSKNNLIIKEI